MLTVAICDDEHKISAELETALIEIFGRLNIRHEIDVYFNGHELYRRMENRHYDLILLDIEFAKNEINGVEVGRLIRNRNNIVSIVYISWEMKYSMQLFDIRPLNFLIKPLDGTKIEKVVRTYLKIAGHLSKEFEYKIGHELFKIQIKDILFLESRGRKLILNLANGRREEFYGSLKEVYENQLKRFDFLFIHASYVVNYDYITRLQYNRLYLTEEAVPFSISQNKRNQVREDYFVIRKRRGTATR